MIKSDPELELFPVALVPKSRDTVAMYEYLTSRLDAAGYTPGALALHLRALGSNDDLAEMLRSVECLSDNGLAAERYAVPAHDRESIGAARARASAAAIAGYKRSIAEQLAGAEGHALQKHARRYLEILNQRDQALAAERARAEQAREDAERAAAEKRAQEQAERERLAAEQAELARRAQSASAVAAEATNAYLAAARRWLSAELEASGIAKLRVRDGRMKGTYSMQDVLTILRNASLAEITAIGAAMERAEAAAE